MDAKSGLQVVIKWTDCISKSQIILLNLFSKTGSGLTYNILQYGQISNFFTIPSGKFFPSSRT